MASFLSRSSLFTRRLTSSPFADATSILRSACVSLTFASDFFSSYSTRPTRSSRAFIRSEGVMSLNLVAVPWRTML